MVNEQHSASPLWSSLDIDVSFNAHRMFSLTSEAMFPSCTSRIYIIDEDWLVANQDDDGVLLAVAFMWRF